MCLLFCVRGTRLCKTYHSFRALASQLKKVAEKDANQIEGPITRGSIPKDVVSVVMFSDSVYHLVNSKRYEHLGKVCEVSCSKFDGTIVPVASPTDTLYF
jgi:hypothetical protein